MQAVGPLVRTLITAGGRSAATTGGRIVITEGGKKAAVEATKGVAAVVLAKEMSEDATKQEKCNKCEAYSIGGKHEVRRSMGDRTNTQYQLKIANLKSYPLVFKAGTPYISDGNKKETTPIHEWLLSGVSFDGLWPMECILVEAKGRYAQFLDKKKPEIIRKRVYSLLVTEATSHKAITLVYKTAKLNWFFLEKDAKEYFDKESNNIVSTIYLP